MLGVGAALNSVGGVTLVNASMLIIIVTLLSLVGTGGVLVGANIIGGLGVGSAAMLVSMVTNENQV
jgi:hypothetical protein